MKIIVLSSHTSSLFWFRMDMMKTFVEKGHCVIAVGSEPEDEWKDRFENNNIQYKQIYVQRNGINPINDIKTFLEINKFLKEEKPAKIFAYQAKTIVYGSVAAKINKITEFYPLIAGLGSIFRGEGFKNKIIKSIMIVQYKMACSFSQKVFFQNRDDEGEFLKFRLVTEDKTVIINGSGVNLNIFKPEPLPESIAFLYIGRLIKDKGIMEYLKASKILKQEYPEVRFLLVGPFDSNPSALKKDELDRYINEGVIEYFGEQKDVRPFIKQCSTYVLPSYHEGTPKTVLEAMAIGRAVITSDAPGCRETVIDGYNGYLVKVKDIDGLVTKMKILIKDLELNKHMSTRSLEIVKDKYDVNIVNQLIIESMNIM